MKPGDLKCPRLVESSFGMIDEAEPSFLNGPTAKATMGGMVQRRRKSPEEGAALRLSYSFKNGQVSAGLQGLLKLDSSRG